MYSHSINTVSLLTWTLCLLRSWTLSGGTETAMFTFITNIPIFRRLFYAFMLAAVIPGVVIVILGLSFVGRLESRSAATKNITEAAQQARNANTMIETLNSQLNVLYNRQYQSMQPLQAADRTAKIQQIQTEEKALA